MKNNRWNHIEPPPPSLRARAEELLRASPDEFPTMPTADVHALVHALNVHQMELEIQNEELRQAQLELCASRDRYSDLYDFAPVGFLTLTPEGRILEANLTAARMLGCDRRALEGTRLSKFIRRDAQDEFYFHCQAVFSSRDKQVCELPVIRADGSPFRVRLESVAAEGEPHPHCRTALIDVSDVYLARQQLRDSETRYRRLTEAVTDYVFTVRLHNGCPIQTIHRTDSEELTGYPPEAFAADPALWTAIVPQQDRSAVERHLEQVLLGGIPKPLEHRIQRKDGSERWVLRITSPECDPTGRLVGYDGLLRDITDRRQAEERVRRLNETLEQRIAERTAELEAASDQLRRTQFTVDRSQDAVFWIKQDGGFLYVNDAACQLTGYQRTELLSLSVADIDAMVTPENWPHLWEEFAAGSLRFGERSLQTHDGRVTPVELSATHLRYDHQEFICAYVRDVSERNRAQHALSESESRLRAILSTASDSIITLDESALIETANPASEKMFGYSQEELLGQPFSMLLAEPDREEFGNGPEKLHAAAAVTSVDGSRELTGRRKHGAMFPMELTLSKVSQPGIFTGIIRDVSARKSAEERLHREHLLNENIINTAQSIILVLDCEGRVVNFNPYAESLTGWKLEDVRGRDWFETFLEDPDRPSIRQLFSRALTGERTRGNVNAILTADGRAREVQWYDAPLTDASGELIGLLCIGQDVTERRALTRHVLNASADEQRRIGQDLHDSLGQEIAGLTMMADALSRSLNRSSASGAGMDLSPLTEIADKLAHGMKNALQQLRRVARGLHPVEIDPHGLNSALQELARNVSEQYSVSCEFCERSPVDVHEKDTATHLYRIAQEAITNAITHGRAAHVTISLGQHDGRAHLRVRDDGSGIPEDAEQHGGLGLKSMHYRASLIGAQLTIQSAENTGTIVECRFRVR